jgi:hypothetical protein
MKKACDKAYTNGSLANKACKKIAEGYYKAVRKICISIICFIATPSWRYFADCAEYRRRR